MKLNVTPKELLALYNLLLMQEQLPKRKYEPGMDPVPDHVYLDQIFARIRSLVIASIGREPEKARFEDVLEREQAKIDKLKVGLVDVEEERDKLRNELAQRDGGFLVSDRGEDLVVPQYPNRPRRAQGRKK